MNREQALAKLNEVTEVTTNRTVYGCYGCSCITIPYDDGECVWFDRYTFHAEEPHTCECHDFSREGYEA